MMVDVANQRDRHHRSASVVSGMPAARAMAAYRSTHAAARGVTNRTIHLGYSACRASAGNSAAGSSAPPAPTYLSARIPPPRGVQGSRAML